MAQFDYNIQPVDFIGQYQAGAAIADARKAAEQADISKERIRAMIANGEIEEATKMIEQLGLNPMDFNLSIGEMLGAGPQNRMQTGAILQSNAAGQPMQSNVGMALGGQSLQNLPVNPFGGF